MKNKRELSNILSLDKETIAKLHEQQASEVEGGATFYRGITCCENLSDGCIVRTGGCG